jgi:hypothetical protein
MNIAASMAQAQVSQSESAKSQDAQRNKQAADARQLSRLAEQHQDEVESTEEAEHLRVQREGDGQEGKGRQPAEQDDDLENSSETPALYDSKGDTNNSEDSKPDPEGLGHIDLSV